MKRIERRESRAIALVMALSLAPTTFAQDHDEPAWTFEVRDELALLEAEYETARDEWKTARSEARKAGVPLSRRPEDPIVAYWPRFVVLFDEGTRPAAMWLVENAHKVATKVDKSKRAQIRERQAAVVEKAFSVHAEEPWLDELCFAVAARKKDFGADTLDAWMKEWRAKELPPASEAAAIWLESQTLAWDRKARERHRARIDDLLRAAVVAAPSSPAGRKAGTELFQGSEKELLAELTPWFERSPDGEVARPDLAAWRSRFAELAALGVAPAGAWLIGASWLDEPDADFDRLTELLEDAEDAWQDEVDAAAASDGSTTMGVSDRVVQLYGVRPETLFWHAFEDLERSDPRAAAWLVRHGSAVRIGGSAQRDRQLKRLEALARDHGSDEWLVGLAESIIGDAGRTLGREHVVPVCERWADATTNEDIEVPLRYFLASARLDEDQEAGIALLRALVERWPEHPRARAARGQIVSLTELAIGCTAPEIVGKDLDGVDFKLSDYRGKVVVLDFWGDW